MKTIKALFNGILFFILIIIISGTSFAQESDIMKTVVIKTLIYCDHCKKCESCAGKLEKEFYFEKGIKKVTLDEKAMTLSVVYNSKKTDPNKIRLAISKLGFDADDVKAHSVGVLKLDDCCKKQ